MRADVAGTCMRNFSRIFMCSVQKLFLSVQGSRLAKQTCSTHGSNIRSLCCLRHWGVTSRQITAKSCSCCSSAALLGHELFVIRRTRLRQLRLALLTGQCPALQGVHQLMQCSSSLLWLLCHLRKCLPCCAQLSRCARVLSCFRSPNYWCCCKSCFQSKNCCSCVLLVNARLRLQ